MIGPVMRLLRRKAEAAMKWLRIPSRGGTKPARSGHALSDAIGP